MGKMPLEVESREGLFPDERLIVVRDLEGNEVGSFVPESMISYRDGRPYVDVHLLNSEGDRLLVLLPGEPAGQRNLVVTVRNASPAGTA